jgi:two-component system chemotaxis response regulator CheY
MEKSKKPTVMLVDDDRVTKELLKNFLRNDDYPLIGEAANGVDAVMKCVELKPDIVLLDIYMPKMDGMSALDEILKACPETMVLMISGDATIDKVKEALAKGAAGFLVKPLKPASVLDKISSCWKKKNTLALP